MIDTCHIDVGFSLPVYLIIAMNRQGNMMEFKLGNFVVILWGNKMNIFEKI